MINLRGRLRRGCSETIAMVHFCEPGVADDKGKRLQCKEARESVGKGEKGTDSRAETPERKQTREGQKMLSKSQDFRPVV